MFFVYLVLLLVFLVALLVLFNNNDEVHHLAATVTGLVAALWLFIITSLAIKILIVTLILTFSQHFYLLRRSK